MVKLRLRFSKKGRAIYISQLDLMRTLQRSFQRAGYHLKYSEGFNPHPLLSVALPMSVGISSICEILDFKMDYTPNNFAEMSEKITESLPEGLEVSTVYYPIRKVADIKWLELKGTFVYDDGIGKSTLNDLNGFYHQDQIEVLKKSKRGEMMFDCAPHIQKASLEIVDEKTIDGLFLVSAQNPTINPNLLIKAMPKSLAPDFARFERIEIFTEEFEVFH